ncbi:hypothetical protein F0160_25880 [Paraburkholderia sp. JPY303]|uniref:hypothetical protein n=1 Tax=Paraburkholderia atlantica TaxID=2654982 RepID=UPI001591C969|nr:hypothetical protein [Paraburkholderia atlantica]NUY33908.1 hypothetical protein [Paraburkholderia atlantica]
MTPAFATSADSTTSLHQVRASISERYPLADDDMQRATRIEDIRTQGDLQLTDVRSAESGALLATLTHGARSVLLTGPKRKFSERDSNAVVEHALWVRTLSKPFNGTVDLTWLMLALASTQWERWMCLVSRCSIYAAHQRCVTAACALQDLPLTVPLRTASDKRGATSTTIWASGGSIRNSVTLTDRSQRNFAVSTARGTCE